MYTARWLILFRILLSTLILLGLLWLVASGWPRADHANTAADWPRDPGQRTEELAPLFWQKETACPAVNAAATT
jgi:hypothetical protein